jgi:hypothetical protein
VTKSGRHGDQQRDWSAIINDELGQSSRECRRSLHQMTGSFGFAPSQNTARRSPMSTDPIEQTLRKILDKIERIQPDFVTIWPTKLEQSSDGQGPTPSLTIAAEATQFTLGVEKRGQPAVLHDCSDISEIAWLAAEIEQRTGLRFAYQDTQEFEHVAYPLGEMSAFLTHPRRLEGYRTRGPGTEWSDTQEKIAEMFAMTQTAHGRMALRTKIERHEGRPFWLP